MNNTNQDLVMIIDDSAVTRKILEVALGREGISCISFADGAEAFLALQQQPELHPAVIIVDIGLPRLDGYRVAQKVRSSTRLNRTAIVMLSGRDGVIDRLKGRLAGANDYVVKPFKTQDIVSVVERHLHPVGALQDERAPFPV